MKQDGFVLFFVFAFEQNLYLPPVLMASLREQTHKTKTACSDNKWDVIFSVASAEEQKGASKGGLAGTPTPLPANAFLVAEQLSESLESVIVDL